MIMGREVKKEIKEKLHILGHHGLKQIEIAEWIKKKKRVKGFSQPMIARIRKGEYTFDKNYEFVSYLNEILEILEVNNLYFELDIPLKKSEKKQIREILFTSDKELILLPKSEKTDIKHNSSELTNYSKKKSGQLTIQSISNYLGRVLNLFKNIISLNVIFAGLIMLYFKFDIVSRVYNLGIKSATNIHQLFFPVFLIFIGFYILFSEKE